MIVDGKQKLQGNPAIWSSSRGVKYLQLHGSTLSCASLFSLKPRLTGSPGITRRFTRPPGSKTGRHHASSLSSLSPPSISSDSAGFFMRRNASRRLGMRRPWPEAVQIDELRNRQWCSLRTHSKTRKETGILEGGRLVQVSPGCDTSDASLTLQSSAPLRGRVGLCREYFSGVRMRRWTTKLRTAARDADAQCMARSLP